MRKSCMDPAVAKEHKLLSQMPIQGFLHMNGGLPAAIEQYAYVWFIGFVYRLRNALFHEIIDPLDVMWQQVFKNAYLVLKQIVDVNISRLQNVAELKKNSFSKYCCEFKAEPPPEIAREIEPLLSDRQLKIRCGGLMSDISCAFNNFHIRHNNLEDGKWVKPAMAHLKDSDIVATLDALFDMIVALLTESKATAAIEQVQSVMKIVCSKGE